MFKKLFVVAGVLLAGGAAWMFTDASSYAKTAWAEIKDTVKSQVPVDFEIKRAKEMLAGLDTEKEKLISQMAQHRYTIDREQKDIERKSAWLTKEEAQIRDLNAKLKSGDDVFVSTLGYSTKRKFVTRLERRFNRFQMLQSAVENKKVSLENYKEQLAAAMEHLEGIRAARSELEARLEKLETELQIVRANEARNQEALPFDDSELAKVKALVEEIERKVETRLFEAELRADHEPVFDRAVPEIAPDLSVQIDAYFDQTPECISVQK